MACAKSWRDETVTVHVSNLFLQDFNNEVTETLWNESKVLEIHFPEDKNITE